METNVIDQTAHLLGNYHKYYTFHSAECRVSLLEKKGVFSSIWKLQNCPKTFVYLDIGCNEGELSYNILKLIRSEIPDDVKCILVGCDIDSELVSLARSKFCGPVSQTCAEKVDSDFSSSQFEESPINSLLINTEIYFETVNFTDKQILSTFRQKLQSIFQLSSSSFFHFISVFSTTMWIHINHGDEGLRDFFRDVRGFLLGNGTLLVEPQPPKCYTNAARRCRKMRISYPPYLEKVDRANALVLLNRIVTEDIALDGSVCFGQEIWGRALSLYFDSSILQLEILS
jgi:SAM-dependent methyltransferase